MPRLTRVYETILYCPSPPGLETVGAFYKVVLGLSPIHESADLLDAFRLPDGGVLLLFDPRASIKPGREVPSHGAIGPGHLAFAMEPGTYDAWLTHLLAAGVVIEQEVVWPADTGRRAEARSIYVRDPAGNSVELVEGEIWGGPPDPR
jgi:catechol 2,3-dioxygenase-like lactoylglutathione lyase family enzyme